MKDYDILTAGDEVQDLVVKDHDLALGNTLQQNVLNILQSAKGEWKEYPSMGVAIGECVGDDNMEAVKREVVEQLRRDGMDVGVVSMNGKNININAKY